MTGIRKNTARFCKKTFKIGYPLAEDHPLYILYVKILYIMLQSPFVNVQVTSGFNERWSFPGDNFSKRGYVRAAKGQKRKKKMYTGIQKTKKQVSEYQDRKKKPQGIYPGTYCFFKEKENYSIISSDRKGEI